MEFSERISRIPSYPVAGGYAEEAPLVRLASNEIPYPPLAEVREAIAPRERTAQPLSRPLERAPAPAPVGPLRSTRRRGSRSGTDHATSCWPPARRCSSRAPEVVYSWPSFSVYPHLGAASGARAVTVALDSSYRHDLPAMLREITVATRLVIVCNPNNPTSTAIPLEGIAEFLAEVPAHVCVIVDEAYCEFNLLDDPDASIELLAHHPNLVLLRTFSKVHGLCGLRVGFALCGSEELPRALDQVRQPFYCNALAQAAAVEALAHQDAVLDRVTRTVAERISVDERLRALGIEPADSQANFCWFELGSDRDEEQVIGRTARARRARTRPAPPSAPRCPRCASPTAPPRRTHGSSTLSPPSFSPPAEAERQRAVRPATATVQRRRLRSCLPSMDLGPSVCYKPSRRP